MPNQNQGNQGNQGKQGKDGRQSQGAHPGEQREVNHGREVDIDEDRELGDTEESQDREVQSGGRGQTGGKARDLKTGQLTDEEGTRERQSGQLGGEDEELDTPGGDSRARGGMRTDDRDDGEPDEPMPSASRK